MALPKLQQAVFAGLLRIEAGMCLSYTCAGRPDQQDRGKGGGFLMMVAGGLSYICCSV